MISIGNHTPQSLSPGVSNIDPRVLEAIDELDELRKTRSDALQIPRAEGFLLHQIALAAGAKVIIEVGTSYGFSGLWWGDALRRTGGHLHTIDLSEKKYESSKATFGRAGLSDVITNHLGDAGEVLPRIVGPIDLAFIDSDRAFTRRWFDLIWPKLRPAGSVLIDNATTHRGELAEYVAHVRSRDDATSTEIAVGNGVEWTIKLR